MTSEPRQRLRDVSLVAVVGCAALIGVASAVVLLTADNTDPTSRALPPGAVGSPNPVAAAERYVRALNDKNEDALRALSPGVDASVETAVDARLAAWGGRNIVVTETHVRDSEIAHESIADVVGTSAAGPYAEKIFVVERQGQWLVNLTKNTP